MAFCIQTSSTAWNFLAAALKPLEHLVRNAQEQLERQPRRKGLKHHQAAFHRNVMGSTSEEENVNHLTASFPFVEPLGILLIDHSFECTFAWFQR